MHLHLPAKHLDGQIHDELVDLESSYPMEEHQRLHHCAIAHPGCILHSYVGSIMNHIQVLGIEV